MGGHGNWPVSLWNLKKCLQKTTLEAQLTYLVGTSIKCEEGQRVTLVMVVRNIEVLQTWELCIDEAKTNTLPISAPVLAQRHLKDICLHISPEESGLFRTNTPLIEVPGTVELTKCNVRWENL